MQRGLVNLPSQQMRLDTPDLAWFPKAHTAVKASREQLLVTLGCDDGRKAGDAVAVCLWTQQDVRAGVHVPQQHLAVIMACEETSRAASSTIITMMACHESNSKMLVRIGTAMKALIMMQRVPKATDKYRGICCNCMDNMVNMHSAKYLPDSTQAA